MMTTPRPRRLWLLASLVACQRDRASTARPDRITIPAPDVSTPTAPQPAQDAAPPPAAEINLLRLPGAAVSVSSVVNNPRDAPANLVDGNLDTTWSSRTGELQNAEVDFQVPSAAHVRAIEMTVGMTRRGDAGDLFTMNPRIRQIDVYRDGVLIRSALLDIDNRGLQTVPVDTAGGIFRIVATNVVPGSRAAWREMSISELRVPGSSPAGTSAALANAPPAVSVGQLVARALPTERYEPTPGQPLPVGCFAWSASTETAACTAGRAGHNIDSDDGHASSDWRLRFLDPHRSAVPLITEIPGDPEVITQPLRPATRSRVQAALAAGGYVSVQALARTLKYSATVAWTGESAFRWTHRQTDGGGVNQAPTNLETLEVRWTARGAWTPLTSGEGPENSTVRLVTIPGDRFALVSVETSIGDEGVSGTIVRALRCDRTLQRCE